MTLPEALFSTLMDAQAQIAIWKEDYNHHRPHSLRRQVFCLKSYPNRAGAKPSISICGFRAENSAATMRPVLADAINPT
ncbi:integrase core domain-containing protein [Brucellaceae bacterium D45D]